MIVVTIFSSIVLPIFILIGLGALLDRIFRLDLRTLSKVNYNLLVPALVFTKILEADFSRFHALNIVLFALVHLLLLGVLTWGAFSWGRLREARPTLVCTSLFCNVGNYGIPLALLAFGEGLIGPHVIMLLLQNLLLATVGVWLLQPHGRSLPATLAVFFKVPVVYAVVLALVFQATDFALPQPVFVPVSYLSDALIAVALLTLGVQLGRSRVDRNLSRVGLVLLVRLALSPLLAFALLPLFGVTREVWPVLIVACGLPTAVNVYILSAEFQREEELASQAVFWTTLASALSLSVLLALLAPAAGGG